jgi:hypothetical protein
VRIQCKLNVIDLCYQGSSSSADCFYSLPRTDPRTNSARPFATKNHPPIPPENISHASQSSLSAALGPPPPADRHTPVPQGHRSQYSSLSGALDPVEPSRHPNSGQGEPGKYARSLTHFDYLSLQPPTTQGTVTPFISPPVKITPFISPPVKINVSMVMAASILYTHLIL